MPVRLVTAALALSAALLLAPAAAKARTLNVVASFSVLADVVAEVGGDHVKVRSLVPAGGDPHDHEPTPDDAKALRDADLVILSGDGLETWFTRLVAASGYRGQPIIASRGIETASLEEEGVTVTDPHVWNSAANGMIWARNVLDALAQADPEDAAAIRATGERYIGQLADLDRSAKTTIAAIPPEHRKVLTSHDAFGYLGRRYGITFLAPLGVSTEAEASAADLAKLIRQIKAEGVKVYFFENSNDPRLVRQVAQATGAEPGGELYAESLSAAGGPAATYAAMLRYNIDQLAAAMRKTGS